ncbi:MAG: hypothetical protein UZ16_OP3001002161 [Candidatus Hinthialibacteria bacterium OLB16]|nr:MAG: hypothetical protein UZ16_OP3001002161 [Candidatus Hinthialibacteria bacterium OLB16]
MRKRFFRQNGDSIGLNSLADLFENETGPAGCGDHVGAHTATFDDISISIEFGFIQVRLVVKFSSGIEAVGVGTDEEHASSRVSFITPGGDRFADFGIAMPVNHEEIDIESDACIERHIGLKEGISQRLAQGISGDAQIEDQSRKN